MDLCRDLAKLCEADAPLRVEGKDALEQGVGFARDGQDGAQEVWVAEIGIKGLVAGTSLLPRVAAAGEVHEDYPKGPYVIVQGGVATLVVD